MSRDKELLALAEYHEQHANGTPDQWGNKPVKPNTALEAWHREQATMLRALAGQATGGEACTHKWSTPNPCDACAAILRAHRDWFEAQAKSISKGNGSTWDLMQVREQRDLCDAALGNGGVS